MFADFPLFPQQASTIASEVDTFYFFMIAVSAFFAVLIATLVIVFAIRYRRRAADAVGTGLTGSLQLEILWSVIPLGIAMVMFTWGADLYFRMYRPPRGAMEIYVVGKQWMWKIQHMTGHAEINELHVPVGRPVRLIMGSEDVIHSFFIPAFRVKSDVIPGRLTSLWFEVTRPGRYRIFCAEYCGTQHAGMIGWVIAMEPADFQDWLVGFAPEEPLAEAGARLFAELGCATCHEADETVPVRGPRLEGLFGSTVELEDGRAVEADEAYIRESILNPNAQIVAGYPPVMPPYQGLVTEEQLLQLVAYIKSLAPEAPGARLEAPAGGPGGAR